MSEVEQQLVLKAIHRQLNHAISMNLSTGITYGMFLAMYCISIRILLSKGSLFHSQGHMFLFGTSTIIFILSTIVIILGPALMSQRIRIIIKIIDPSLNGIWPSHKSDFVDGIIVAITRLNPIFSDAVCAWRAIVLWKYDRRVVTILSICLFGTFAASIYDLKLALGDLSTQLKRNVLRSEGEVAVIIVGPILFTNILSTSFIAWKAWDYRRTVGAHVRKGRPFRRVEKVLGLLIESGFVYCILWMIYLFTAFGILPGTGSYIVNLNMLFISSMYPVCINVLAVTTQSYEFSEVWVQSVQ